MKPRCSNCGKEVDLLESPPVDESKGEWELIFCSPKCVTEKRIKLEKERDELKRRN